MLKHFIGMMNDKKGESAPVGILFVCLVGGITIFIIYIVFSILTPIAGSIGTGFMNSMINNPSIDPGFLSLFVQNGRWVYFDAIGWFYGGVVLAIIASIILYAARRHDNEDLIPG
jgi:hypothetical protein